MGEQPLTIGIEEEFQIVDAGGELKAHIDILLAAAVRLRRTAEQRSTWAVPHDPGPVRLRSPLSTWLAGTAGDEIAKNASLRP